MQHDPARLRSAFLRSFLVVTTVVIGIATLIMVGAADFVAIALGKSWQELGAIIPLMAIWGACRAMGGATASVFFSVGKPIWASYYQVVMLVMLAVLLVPMTGGGGLAGVAWTLAAVGLTAQTLRYPLIARFLDAPVSELYLRTFMPMLCSAIAVASAWAVLRLLPLDAHIVRLAVGTLTAGAMYLLGLAVWDRTSEVHVFQTLLSVVPARLRRGRLA
jgi:O-antigen/teichoic acid export membrane protein